MSAIDFTEILSHRTIPIYSHNTNATTQFLRLRHAHFNYEFNRLSTDANQNTEFKPFSSLRSKSLGYVDMLNDSSFLL